MFLKRVKLKNYRNYSELELEFGPTTLLIGDNAQGKSNLLEAIYVLATSKSPKAERDADLIKQGEDVAWLEAEVYKATGNRVQGAEDVKEDVVKLEIGLSFDYAQDKQSALTKRVKVNGVPRRIVDYIGHLVVVTFSPEDIALVSGPPALRRWHLDLTLSQIDKDYKRALTEYSEVIINKNRVLKRIKEGGALVDELTFWVDKQITSGQVVSQTRQKFFDFINNAPPLLGEFEFGFLPSEISYERVSQYQQREIASCSSLIGPHRDDFVFKQKGRNLAKFGSRGEQRTAVLELKLLELEYINQIKVSKPILLLDDVFSELDEHHRALVMSIIANQQTVLSAVENENIPAEFLKQVQVIKIEAGKIRQP